MNNNHINQLGDLQMIDVSDKEITQREAKAAGYIELNDMALSSVIGETNRKGDVLNTARIAGINAIEQTSNLIPLAHNIIISSASVEFKIDEKHNKIKSIVTVRSEGKTGVEIESLMGVEISLLTIYDMCKYLDRNMIISDVKLLNKSGGKSGDFLRVDND